MPRVCSAKIALPSRVEIEAEIANLSAASVFIKTVEPLLFGDRLTLTLFDVAVEATVAFVSGEPRGAVLVFTADVSLREQIAINAPGIEVLAPSPEMIRNSWVDGLDPNTEPGITSISDDLLDGLEPAKSAVSEELEPATALALPPIEPEPEMEPALELDAIHLDILPPEIDILAPEELKRVDPTDDLIVSAPEEENEPSTPVQTATAVLGDSEPSPVGSAPADAARALARASSGARGLPPPSARDLPWPAKNGGAASRELPPGGYKTPPKEMPAVLPPSGYKTPPKEMPAVSPPTAKSASTRDQPASSPPRSASTRDQPASSPAKSASTRDQPASSPPRSASTRDMPIPQPAPPKPRAPSRTGDMATLGEMLDEVRRDLGSLTPVPPAQPIVLSTPPAPAAAPRPRPGSTTGRDRLAAGGQASPDRAPMSGLPPPSAPRISPARSPSAIGGGLAGQAQVATPAPVLARAPSTVAPARAPSTIAVTPAPAGGSADLPLLENDGVTLRFASADQYRSQHKANIAHGGIIVRSSPLPIGTQKFLGVEIPGRERYTISARVTFIGDGTVGFVIDSFPIHKAQLKAFADA